MSSFDRSNRVAAARRPWVSPAVKLVGTVAEILKAGTGKPSVALGDPGESTRKPPMSGA